MSLIITPAYILSFSDQGDANNSHIGYQNWLDTILAADIAVSSETATGPKDAVLRPDTFEFWQGSAMPATITFDFGMPRAVDYVGIAGHDIGSVGATLKVEHSPDNSIWTEFGNELAPATDAPIVYLDESVTKRYWRITLSGSTDVPQIAVIYIGEVLVIQRGIYGGHSPAPLSRDTLLFQNMSDGGQFLGQYIRRQGVSGGVSFRHLTAGWYRSNFDPFVRAARTKPFFIAWRPVTFPLEVAYGWTDENIQPSNMGIRDLMEVRFTFKGIGYLD